MFCFITNKILGEYKQRMVISFLLLFQGIYTQGILDLKFLGQDGLRMENPGDHSIFTIIAVEGAKRVILRATNHHYFSDIEVFADPCMYQLRGIFSRSLGILDLCEQKIEFIWDENQYKVNYRNRQIDYRSSFQVAFDKVRKQMPFREVQKYYREVGTTPPDHTVGSPYRIDVFIFNDLKRVNRFKQDINKNTIEIMKMVEHIYADTPVQPVLKGILNMKEHLEVKSNILESFKDVVEPLRFSPFNLRTSLSKSDLIVMISGDISHFHQGMSYYGGASRLDTSYAVVHAPARDSSYYVAKKLSHEIAHSLGVLHDRNAGFLMEEKTCKKCSDDPRRFSQDSISQMSRFLKIHQKVFSSKPALRYGDEETLKTVEDASEFVSERRKHSFLEIVKNRLGGRVPIGMDMSVFLSTSMLLYSAGIFLAIYYLRKL